jgi:hypothetical protein
MFRRSLLLFSIVSISALAAWGFAPARATTSSASPSATADCRVRLSVNAPTLAGPLYHPDSVSVTWTIDNVPPCYTITSQTVTFNIVQRDGGNVQKIVTVPGNATSATKELLINAPEAARLFKKDRPTSITATVVATAVPIDNQIRGTDVESAEVTPR